MFKTVTALALGLARQTDAPERLLIVASPCQSDIKRTLRARRFEAKDRMFGEFRATRKVHSTQMVNAEFPEWAEYGFEMVDAADTPNVLGKTIINQKFTPNQISRALRKFSAI
jgi:hypothetical protein